MPEKQQTKWAPYVLAHDNNHGYAVRATPDGMEIGDYANFLWGEMSARTMVHAPHEEFPRRDLSEDKRFYLIKTDEFVIYAMYAYHHAMIDDERYHTETLTRTETNPGRPHDGVYAFFARQPVDPADIPTYPDEADFQLLFDDYVLPAFPEIDSDKVLPEGRQTEGYGVITEWESRSFVNQSQQIDVAEPVNSSRRITQIYPESESDRLWQAVAHTDAPITIVTNAPKQSERDYGRSAILKAYPNILTSPDVDMPYTFEHTPETVVEKAQDNKLLLAASATGFIASLAAIFQPFRGKDNNGEEQKANWGMRLLGVAGVVASVATPLLLMSSNQENDRESTKQR